MDLIILKNNSEIIARIYDSSEEATYSMLQIENLPEYPEEDPGFGKEWKLMYIDGNFVWQIFDRDLTTMEKLQQRDEALEALELLGVK